MQSEPVNPATIPQSQIDKYAPSRFAGYGIDDLPNGIRKRVIRRVEAERRGEPVAGEPVDG